MRVLAASAVLAAAAGAAPHQNNLTAAEWERGVLRSNAVPASLCGGQASEAGYFLIDPATKKNYFYWFHTSKSNPAKDPVVFWHTGGPGCSSTLALLTENGPCTVDKSGTHTNENPYGWNAQANVVWVDQPAGAGFSFSDAKGMDHNETEVARDMYRFVQAFFAAHPALLSNEFYISGESYGGHYVPAIGNAVFQGNNNLQPGDVAVNLKGLLIGNGLTDPLIQYQYYPELAYNYSIQKVGHPSVSLADYEGMVAAWPQCQSLIAQCQTDTSTCPTAQSFCNDAMFGPYEANGLNPYDIRLQCAVQPLCYDESPSTNFLNDPATQAALGVSVTWAPCNFVVNGDFSNDWMKRFNALIPPMMAAGIRFIQYSGDVDFICNWLGNQAWTLQLDWPGNAGFNAAPVTTWNVSGVPAGEYRHYDTMTFLRVYNAGHMVPSDQPAAALALFNAFITGSFP